MPLEHGFFGRPDPGLGFVPLGLLTLRHEARGDAGDSEICGVHQVDAMSLFADTPDCHCGSGAPFCTVVRNAEGELCTRDAVQLGFRVAVGDTPPFCTHQRCQCTAHGLVLAQPPLGHVVPFAFRKMGFKLRQGPRSPFVPLPENNLGVRGLNGQRQSRHGRKGRGFSPRLQSTRLPYFCRVKT